MSETTRAPSILRHAATYGAGNVLMYVAGFLLLPLYTRCLGPAEFGALEVCLRVGEVVAICLLFNAFRQGLLTFYRQGKDDQERERVLGTALALLAGVLAGGGLLVVLAGPTADLLGADNALVWQLALSAALLEGAHAVLLGLAQARLESSFIVRMNLVQLLLRVALAVTFVVGLGWGIVGVLAASALAVGCNVAALFGREVVRGRLRMNGAVLRGLVGFALPFLPGGLCLFVLNNGDRFLLLHWAGEEEVGVYALGYKIAALTTAFTISPLLMGWSALMYDWAKREDAADVFGRAFTRILAVHLLLGLGVCIFQDEAVRLLGGEQYAAAATVIAPVVLACWFLGLQCLADGGFYIRRRTGLKLGITLASTVVVLVLYGLLIPALGGLGAALATAGGFAFQAGLTRVVAQRIFLVRYEDGRLAALLLLAAGLWAVSRCLPAGPEGWAGKAGLWLAWPVLLWVLGVVSAEEKRWVRGQLGLASRGRKPQEDVTLGPAPLSSGGSRPRLATLAFEEDKP